MRELNVSAGSRALIKRVLTDVEECHLQGVEYSAGRKEGSGGANKLIVLGSVEAHIVADGIEGGLGLTQTICLVNTHRGQCVPPLVDVGRSAVHSASLWLKPLVTPILDSKQGSFDVTSAWAIARLFFVLQLLVRFGMMTGLAAWLFVLAGEPGEGLPAAEMASMATAVPAFFILGRIGSLELTQIAWWDETHKKPIIGGAGHDSRFSRTQYRFRRDEHGGLDPEGEYAERKSQLKAKYLEENRFSLGCAKVERGGEEIGLRAKVFDYSGQWILTIKDWTAKVWAEVARVKALPGSGAPWVVGKREPGELWMEDSVIFVKGVGPAKQANLELSGITTVAQLLATTCPSLAALRAHAASALPGSFPVDRVVDHKEADNPYESLYGTRWQEVIAATSFLSGYVCITVMITHIIVESAALFVGTPHEHDWVFYHDALSQLTAHETIEWMKTQMFDGVSYYDRWIKPMDGLSSGTVYGGRPPGNGPELVPRGASLN